MKNLIGFVGIGLRPVFTNMDQRQKILEQDLWKLYRRLRGVLYRKTGNTEYLTDAANYLMFEFMYPSVPNAYFKATESKESAGIVGISIKEIEEISNVNQRDGVN